MKVIPDFLLLRAFAMMMNLPQESKIGINDVSTTFSFFCVDKQAQNVMSIIMLVIIISLFDDKLNRIIIIVSSKKSTKKSSL